METNINEILNYSTTLTVLYVEDDRDIREQMTDILQDFFQQVIVAEDGQQGLEKFSAYKERHDTYPDLMITDIRMPHLDGIEMSKKILSLHPEQIIIIHSAHDESDMLLELINMDINHFLMKPLQLQQLYQTEKRNHQVHQLMLRHFVHLQVLKNL